MLANRLIDIDRRL